MIAAEIAHWMALWPLCMLVVMHVHGERKDRAWWWLAGAFAVSFIADSLAHFLDPWVISLAYPMSQAALVGAVFLSKREALSLLVLLCCATTVAILAKGVQGPDVILSSTANGAVCWMVWDRWELGRLRTALLVSFGAVGLAWLCFSLWQVVPVWYGYQALRLVGLFLFCWSASTPHLRLRTA